MDSRNIRFYYRLIIKLKNDADVLKLYELPSNDELLSLNISEISTDQKLHLNDYNDVLRCFAKRDNDTIYLYFPNEYDILALKNDGKVTSCEHKYLFKNNFKVKVFKDELELDSNEIYVSLRLLKYNFFKDDWNLYFVKGSDDNYYNCLIEDCEVPNKLTFESLGKESPFGICDKYRTQFVTTEPSYESYYYLTGLENTNIENEYNKQKLVFFKRDMDSTWPPDVKIKLCFYVNKGRNDLMILDEHEFTVKFLENKILNIDAKKLEDTPAHS